MQTSTGIIDFGMKCCIEGRFSKSRVQEEVLFFPNPADQKSHVKAFTYESST